MHPHRQGNLAVVIGTSLVGVIGAMVVMSLSGAVVPQSGPSLPVYGHVPDFSLVDHQARPISRATLAGSVWIADFIFTRCAGQCPLMSGQMAKLQQVFEGVPEIRLVSFSVDPTYDTPARLAAYATAYGVASERWQFATEAGTPPVGGVAEGSADRRSRRPTEAGTTALGGGRRGNPAPQPSASGSSLRDPERTRGIGEAGGMTGPITTVHALARQGFRLGVSEEGSLEEPITHSVRLVLVDQRGMIRGYYDATDPRAMAALHDDARRLGRQR